jgi:hypothetical protein
MFDDLLFGQPSGFDTFDLESAYLACRRMSQHGGAQLPLPVMLALMEREGIRLFARINRRVRNTTAASETLIWEARRRAASPGPLPTAEYSTDPARRAREAWLAYPYGLDTFSSPNTDTAVDDVVKRLETAGVFTLDPGESIATYISTRVFSEWLALPAAGPTHGVPRIWKRTRRMHWAGLSLMAGFFRYLEAQVRTPTVANGYASVGWAPAAGWLPAGSSPPNLTGHTATDVQWKDYLSYYALIYLAYNNRADTWRDTIRAAEVARASSGSTMSLRDYLLFRHDRDRMRIGNMVRFVIGLDAFLRLDFMEGATPADFPAASPDTTPTAGRAWVP